MKKDSMQRLAAVLLLLFCLLPAWGCAQAGSAETEELTVDCHRCAPVMLERYGQRVIDETCQTIDAFLAGESSVVWENYELGDMPNVRQLLTVMCPLFDGYAYVPYECMDDDTGRFYWTNCCTKDELDAHREQLEETVRAFLEPLQSGDSDLLKAADLYFRYVQTLSYDTLTATNGYYETLSDAGKAYTGSSFRAIVDGEGVCYSLSDGLTFLYLQAGLDAVPVGSFESETGNGGHAWVMVRLDGKWYYADPTWDMPGDSAWAGILYFGMNEQDRYDAGGYTFASTELFGNDWQADLSVYGLEDDRFSELRDESFARVASLVPDHERQCLTVTTADGVVHTVR